jgi:hypothetical protein
VNHLGAKGEQLQIAPQEYGVSLQPVLLGQADSNLFFNLDDRKERNTNPDDQ